MRKAVLTLAAAGIMLGTLPAATASATTWPTLGCNIQPNSNDNFTTACFTSKGSSSYSVDFYAQGGTGTFTYSWTPPAGWPIASGCTSTSPVCGVIANANGMDANLTATVVISQGGSSNTQTSKAHMLAVCGRFFC